MERKLNSIRTRKVSYTHPPSNLQSKGGVRSIIDKNTPQIPSLRSHSRGVIDINQTSFSGSGVENIKESILQNFSSIERPLRNLIKFQQTSEQKLEMIYSESGNNAKIRSQQVHVPFEHFENRFVWLGKTFEESVDRSFQMFVNGDLTYNEMRAFCTESILINLVKVLHLKNSPLSKSNTDETFDSSLESPNTPPNAVSSLQTIENECRQCERTSRRIVEHLCNKYPQVEKFQINKKIQEIAESNQINNTENDDYDMVDKSKVTFQYKEDGDYSEEIMKFINYVIGIPNTELDEGQSVFSDFQTFMSNIFSIVECKCPEQDMEILENGLLSDKRKLQLKVKGEDAEQFQEKVRSYTKFEIGSKIPPNAEAFSLEEIVSGNIAIKSKPVARVVDKWVEELVSKINKAKQTILERTHRFKGINPGERLKLHKNEKEQLYEKVKAQAENVKNFKNAITANLDSVSNQIAEELGNLKDLNYMSKYEAYMGEFCCKLEEAGVEYSIQTLNFLIHSLLKATEELKEKCRSKHGIDKEFMEQKYVNLVTCKIGDLLRCKFLSREEEIIRVFKFLLTMSEMNYKNMFKIIRIKNRLGQSTRDILMNVEFKGLVTCEIQLAINESTNEKQKFMDKFNHFLYELKRAEFGVMLEIATIWVNNSPKSQTFKKAIQEEKKYKRRNRKHLCPVQFNVNTKKYQIYRFPFICGVCKIFYSKQETIFSHLLFDDHDKPICGDCLSQRINNSSRLSYFFKDYKLPEGFRTISSDFVEIMEEIRSFKQFEKENDYFLLAPINSRRVNKFPVRKIEIQDKIIFVENILKNGNLEIVQRYSIDKNKKLDEESEKFFSHYCLFAFKPKIEWIPAKKDRKNWNVLMKDEWKKIESCPIELWCASILIEGKHLLMPGYKNPKVCEIFQLKTGMNVSIIKRAVETSKEVIELSNSNLSDEFTHLPIGISIRMNTIIRELYIESNLLNSIGFVSSMMSLEILCAKQNRIQKIPEMPKTLETLYLSENLISDIQGIQKCQNLHDLDLSCNFITQIKGIHSASLRVLNLRKNQIPKIEGLDKAPNINKLILSCNPIKKIQNIEMLFSLRYLCLGFTSVTVVQNLEELTKLDTLILEGNKILNSEAENQFLHLFPLSMRRLNLNNTKFKNTALLQNLKDLEHLILCQNLLTSISPMGSLANIRTVNLSQNKIEAIPDLKELNDLEELYLAHNQIEAIENLEQNLRLRVLDLSHNKIQDLGIVGCLVSLGHLNLENNRIKVIENIENLKFLSHLQMANNLVAEIVNLPVNVRKVDLQQNQIRTVQWISKFVNTQEEQRAKNVNANFDHLECINIKNNPLPLNVIDIVRNVFELLGSKIVV